MSRDRTPSWFDPGETPETSDELAIGQRSGHLTGNVAMASGVPIPRGKQAREAFVNGPRAEDQEVVAGTQPARDLDDESLQVFEAVRLARCLRDPSAAVAHGGVMSDVARRPVMSRHLGLHSFDSRTVAPEADDDRLCRVDPDEGPRSSPVSLRAVGFGCRGHDRAQAGPASASSARSA